MKFLQFDRNQLINHFKQNYFQEKTDLQIAEIGSCEGALKDLQTWHPKVKSGAIISGHVWDADPEMAEHHLFGVAAPLRNFLKDTDCLTLTNERYHKSWYWAKP